MKWSLIVALLITATLSTLQGRQLREAQADLATLKAVCNEAP